MNCNRIASVSKQINIFHWWLGAETSQGRKETQIFSKKIVQKSSCSVADPGFGQGGAKNFFPRFSRQAKQSLASKVNNIIFQYKRIWEF